jgi:hypothetical protein
MDLPQSVYQQMTLLLLNAEHVRTGFHPDPFELF